MNLPTPRHARNTPRTPLRDLAADIRREYRTGIRQGLTAALARDVPTSTPSTVAYFQRTWRTS